MCKVTESQSDKIEKSSLNLSNVQEKLPIPILSSLELEAFYVVISGDEPMFKLRLES